MSSLGQFPGLDDGTMVGYLLWHIILLLGLQDLFPQHLPSAVLLSVRPWSAPEAAQKHFSPWGCKFPSTSLLPVSAQNRPMAAVPDYYKLLEIPRDASDTDIKKA